jgi:hypothetical protein
MAGISSSSSTNLLNHPVGGIEDNELQGGGGTKERVGSPVILVSPEEAESIRNYKDAQAAEKLQQEKYRMDSSNTNIKMAGASSSSILTNPNGGTGGMMLQGVGGTRRGPEILVDRKTSESDQNDMEAANSPVVKTEEDRQCSTGGNSFIKPDATHNSVKVKNGFVNSVVEEQSKPPCREQTRNSGSVKGFEHGVVKEKFEPYQKLHNVSSMLCNTCSVSVVCSVHDDEWRAGGGRSGDGKRAVGATGARDVLKHSVFVSRRTVDLNSGHELHDLSALKSDHEQRDNDLPAHVFENENFALGLTLMGTTPFRQKVVWETGEREEDDTDTETKAKENARNHEKKQAKENARNHEKKQAKENARNHANKQAKENARNHANKQAKENAKNHPRLEHAQRRQKEREVQEARPPKRPGRWPNKGDEVRGVGERSRRRSGNYRRCCFDFQNTRKCKRGAKCRFYHSEGGSWPSWCQGFVQ